jgi:hypothetical protein
MISSFVSIPEPKIIRQELRTDLKSNMSLDFRAASDMKGSNSELTAF